MTNPIFTGMATAIVTPMTETGIDYEPWHYRYVGVEAATRIREADITLEAFIAQNG